MNRIVERVRAYLRKQQVPPRDYIEDLCDECDALQDVIDKIAKRNAERAYQEELEARKREELES